MKKRILGMLLVVAMMASMLAESGKCVGLYTSPFIWIKADKCKIEDNKCYDSFSVEKIKIENKRIVGLAIRNDRIFRETSDAKAARAFVYTEEKADAQ